MGGGEGGGGDGDSNGDGDGGASAVALAGAAAGAEVEAEVEDRPAEPVLSPDAGGGGPAVSAGSLVEVGEVREDGGVLLVLAGSGGDDTTMFVGGVVGVVECSLARGAGGRTEELHCRGWG